MNKYKYYQLKKKGICTNCCKRKAIKNRVKCQQCLDQDKMYQSKKYQLKSQGTIFKLNKKKYTNSFIMFLASKSDFDCVGENHINYIFKYNDGDMEKAKFYLKTNIILYKNLLERS